MPQPPEFSVGTQFLDSCHVDRSVFALRPDYRAQLLVVEGFVSTATSALSKDLLAAAEEHAQELVADCPVDQLPHIAAWRDAYRAFGAKPQRTRNSLEALTRRAAQGLPRVNTLTDVYNAISVLHQVPVGGEDFDRYAGPAHLVRATGMEDFDTVADGAPVLEHPDAGEVIWRDDIGVTCRRWNWRQGRRTALRDGTGAALFIFDALEPMSDDDLTAAVEGLVSVLATIQPAIRVARRLVTNDG